MKAIFEYLERPACQQCLFSDGKLNHCEACEKLYTEALNRAKELSKKPRFDMLKRLEKEKRDETERMKMSHDWVRAMAYQDTSHSRGMPVVSHCKACNYPMNLFKAKPIYCTKKR